MLAKRFVASAGQLLVAGGIAHALVGLPARAGTLTTLYSFTSGADGADPSAGLIQDSAGVLYGATNHAGASQCAPAPGKSVKGCGTVFSFSKTAGFKTIVSFTGANGAYAANTLLLRGKTLFGSTTNGGINGDGVLFSVNTDGSGFALLHQFSGPDGRSPAGQLQPGAAGILYGITGSGGPYNHGVLFRLAPDGTYAILHAFTGGADGDQPDVLLAGKGGILAGSALLGGIKNAACSSGCGTTFGYVPSTDRFASLFQFDGSVTDGAGPFLGSVGPGNVGYGVAGYLFSDSISERYRNLATFTMNDGGNPLSGPALAGDGSLVGANSFGPNNAGAQGTLYSEKDGIVTNLYLFGGSTDGGLPGGQPLLEPDGTIYGTTERYGAGCSSCGTIYEYTP